MSLKPQATTFSLGSAGDEFTSDLSYDQDYYEGLPLALALAPPSLFLCYYILILFIEPYEQYGVMGDDGAIMYDGGVMEDDVDTNPTGAISFAFAEPNVNPEPISSLHFDDFEELLWVGTKEVRLMLSRAENCPVEDL